MKKQIPIDKSDPSNVAIKTLAIVKVEGQSMLSTMDQVVIEAPLEIQIVNNQQITSQNRSLAITMRTPGADRDLVLGFLFTEGLIGHLKDIDKLEQLGNTMRIYLKTPFEWTKHQAQRNFISHSSCGICGKPSLDSIEQHTCYFPIKNSPRITIATLQQLAHTIGPKQSIFNITGGIHAAGLFDPHGGLIAYKEDIGRHNALDKLIGYALQVDLIPLRQHILFLSGRISYELVQKASLVGIPIIAAVGAPSSLAIELAIANDISLIGFLRTDRFNIYCGAERVLP